MTTIATECTKPSSRMIITHMIGTVIGLSVATLIERAGQPTLGWFIGGIVLALSATISFVRPEKRWTARKIVLIVLVGVAVATANYLLRSL